MNWVDLTIIIILAINLFNGLRRGLIRSIFDIVALFGAVIVAINFFADAASLLEKSFKLAKPLAVTLSFTVTWALVYLAVELLGTLVHKIIAATFFMPLNILGGGALGLAKGLILIFLILQFFIAFPFTKSITSPLEESAILKNSLPYFKLVYPQILKVFPKDIPDLFKFFEPEIKKETPESSRDSFSI